MLQLLPQAIVDGILIGGIYITVAIGFSLAYGVMHVIDFAVGEWIMLGAFMGFYLNRWLGLEPILLFPVIFLSFFVVGLWIQPLIHRVLSGRRGNPVLMGLVFTFGLALMIRGIALTVFGFYSHSIPSSLAQGSLFFQVGPIFVTIPLIRLTGLGYAVLVTMGLYYILHRTDFGLAVRALAQHKEAAGLMGVNARRTGGHVYGLYTGISATTGALIGCIFSISAQMGPDYTIFAFFVVVLAGMGYLPGVPWAAFLLGFVQSFFLIYLSPSYTMLAVFAALYLILLISPKGIFGKGV
ncbi:MAG TPA: branched-chain amino acid ABC transporter permease [Thermodesulforhabdus norvegica]|uniref:Branched-chain amino acid ABC transporter permease n=1 Tax=Thermodesulforhabdus norvegica TaxID=39841 RepID=A0A7C0WVF6_9BACT|nr:branched-chain amino acid ABC transporter permease [Deltaproteobacteria bacterium]MBW2068264.1 branched-chain amino acid ABC transporter permease [Deltaproteobacteria bacterium]HDL90146.1 branched-chain amino acid ABC transporter permease [Thermodesulforhabdus norvegica]